MDALVDLTGGLAERYELKGADPNMYRHLLRAHKSGAFIACSRKVRQYVISPFSLLFSSGYYLSLGLTIFYSGIKYREIDWVLPKVRHYPLYSFLLTIVF